MNKARRHELKMLKYKKRLRNYRLKDGEGKFFAFRSHGSPCSCCVCRNVKYREVRHCKNKRVHKMDLSLDFTPKHLVDILK